MRSAKLSIRTQILLLMGISLVVSLASDVFLGTWLIIRDKASYIDDYSFSQMGVISLEINSELEKLQKLPENIELDLEGSGDLAAIASGLGADVLWVQSARPGTKSLSVVRSFGSPKDQEGVSRALETLGWNTDYPMQEPSLALDFLENKLLVAIPKRDFRIVAELSLDKNISAHFRKEFQVQLVDSSGHSMDYVGTKERKVPILALPQNALSETLNGSFASGVFETAIDRDDYLLSYERVAGTKTTLLCLIPKRLAYTSARTLVRSSVALGLSILMITLGVTLLITRGMIRKIRLLVEATERISSGDFSHQLPVERGGDEISLLSRSFNLMTDKIQMLLGQTAKNARMEAELETAKQVQAMFFPKEPMQTESIDISGETLSASECSGDLWQYARVGESVILFLGDVTGHGVSAALSTASIHSAFKLSLQNSEPGDDVFHTIVVPWLESTHRLLKESSSDPKLRAAFPCLVACIDLRSRRIRITNAGQPFPFLYRASTQSFSSLAEIHRPPLGYESPDPIKFQEISLNPGDFMLWYTDGLFDENVSTGKKLKRKDYLKKLESLIPSLTLSSQSLCEMAMKEGKEFFGSNASNRPDDISVVAVFSKARSPSG